MITPRISRRYVQDGVAGIASRSPGVPMLEVSDLVKRYGNVLALDGCSLQVPAGHQPHSSRSSTHWRTAVTWSGSCAGALPGAAGQAGDRQRVASLWLLCLHAPGYVAGQGQHEAHRLVTGIGGGVEHARAPTLDHGDAVLAAILGSCFRHASRAGPAVHPDTLDAQLGALAHGGLGCLGLGSDQYPVDAAGDRRQVVVAGVAFDVVGVGVHREDLVAPLPQAPVHRVAAVSLRFARDPGDRDPLAGQELGCGLLCTVFGGAWAAEDQLRATIFGACGSFLR
jgi:hypothetical protein